jgi:hypothetical protein
MKVLFFDIDGVVNSDRSSMALGGYPHDFSEADMPKFDHVALGLIRRLCRVTETVIVLSSTWRIYHRPGVVAEALDLPVIDETPDHGSYDTRGSEIAAWLAEHPEVTTFAIVDDVAICDGHPELAARFVQTNPQRGVSLSDYRQLRHLLDPECRE